MGFRRIGGFAVQIGALVVCLVWASFSQAQIKAFPQAEGFGAVATGGRGGDVYHVTNLNDSGAGSLRFGIDNSPSGGRTIVFDVGGWITVNSKLGIDNTKSKITIAGQTAPGGIGVRGNQFSVGADNIVVRHMRFKPGKGAGRVDSAGANADAQYVIYDHISAGFSHDENFSVAGSDVTLQYSTVSFGLEDHSAGSLIEQAHRLSFHHNLYAHNNTRNPKARVNETIDWLDNVVYDYNNGFIAGDSDTNDYFWTANVDGNYYITGPGDTGRPMVRDGHVQNYGLYFGTNGYDNDGDAAHDGTLFTGNGVDGTGLTNVVSGTYTWRATPYATPGVWQDANPQAAYEHVLSEFGATPWDRDEVDQVLYDDVVNRTGTIISHENQLVPLGVTNGGFGTLGGGVAPTDSDQDGIPNVWELKHGTNPSIANNNGDFDFDGYTDLEEYLNDLAAFKAVGPLEFTGIGRYADWKRWTERWEPSRVDDVHINSAIAFIDAVGQKAGNLRLGVDDDSSATLYVTSGWLEVTDDLVIGVDGTGTVDQYGGEVRVLDGIVDISHGSYVLRGGELSTPSLDRGLDGAFSFLGGKLHADVVGFDLANDGGVLAPGHSIGQTNVLGDLLLHDGSVQIELSSAALSDSLIVSGRALLGGALDVQLLSGFTPQNGNSWQILTADSFSGAFDSITPGYSVQQLGNCLWLFAGMGAGGFTSDDIPEPCMFTLFVTAALGVAACRRRKMPTIVAALILLAVIGRSVAVEAATVKTIADSELRENGTTGVGDATDTGTGSGTALNARWNFSTAPTNRNEWIALKFDLSAYSDKTRLQNIELHTYMNRTDANNAKSLRLYALTPGTSGENWNESTITYGSMPGFTFDANSTTNILDVGGAIQSLGTFAVNGVGNEGNIANIDPAALTTLVQDMGSNNLLTVLISYQNSSTGQWRIASREATQTATGVLSGAAGDFAPFLHFEVITNGLKGDYNDDGLIDALDYTVWRNNLGGTELLNEEVSPHLIDVADFLYWKARYGATENDSLGGLQSANRVPEPCNLIAITLAGLAAITLRRALTTMTGR